MKRRACTPVCAVLGLALLLGGCASGITFGASFPIGGNGGVGVVVGPDGKVNTRVGVSVGGGQVSVGGQVDVPVSSD
jgi:hypothetical protein